MYYQAGLRESSPFGTAGIRRLPDAAAAGRDALARQGHALEGAKRLRRFSLGEVARQIAGVEPAVLTEELKARPDLPRLRRFFCVPLLSLLVGCTAPDADVPLSETVSQNVDELTPTMVCSLPHVTASAGQAEASSIACGPGPGSIPGW